MDTHVAADSKPLTTEGEAMQEGYIAPVVIVSSTHTNNLSPSNTSTSGGGGSGAPAWGSILAGILIGVAVGGAIALLLAPRPGVQTRQELSNALDDLKERAEGVLDNVQSSANDLAARTTQTLAQTRENLQRSLEAGKEAYQQRRDELHQELEG